MHMSWWVFVVESNKKNEKDTILNHVSLVIDNISVCDSTFIKKRKKYSNIANVHAFIRNRVETSKIAKHKMWYFR